MWTTISSILLAFTGLFMMFIILLQRGRGGGLAGAFGAMGGQSAFGTKAGDVFTRITIGVAIVWVALAAVTGFAMRSENSQRFQSQAPADAGKDAAKIDAKDGKGADSDAPPFPPENETPAAKPGEANKTEPAKTDAAKAEPAKTEPAKTPPSPEKAAPKAEPPKTDAAKPAEPAAKTPAPAKDAPPAKQPATK